MTSIVQSGKRARATFGLRGLTPLLDTLFLLLFTLLATSEPKSEQVLEAVRIRLPEVEPGTAAESSQYEPVLIEIDENSQIRLEGDSVPLQSWEQLDRQLEARLRGGIPEELPIEILGDERARHGIAVQLLQHLRLRGYLSIQLVANAAEQDTPFPMEAD